MKEGIWQMKVKKDGTFQAEHEGDIFTYRFNSLGIGRGSGFKPFELGEADFSRFIVIGDTIRWSDVYPDIDLSVRYVHDILKVDVIVKNAFMADLKAEAKAGKLDQNDYLTARFDIPQVLLTSKAKQNGKDKDLYAEALDVEQPVYFEKDGKVVHKLRPVEAYLLDDKDEPVFNFEKPIRTAQVWKLDRNGVGVAEMSANIGDLVNLPEGDVVIDPETSFIGNNIIDDSVIYSANPTGNDGESTLLQLGIVAGGTLNFLVGFQDGINRLGFHKQITSASIELYYNHVPDADQNKYAHFSRVTKDWTEGGVTWSSNITVSPDIYGPSNELDTVSLPQNPERFDVSGIFASLYQSGFSEMANKGMILTLDSPPNPEQYWEFYSSEYTQNLNYRPKLTVKYNHAKTEFGADVGYGYNQPNYTNDIRQESALVDNFKTLRYFPDQLYSPGDIGNATFDFSAIPAYLYAASNNQMKVILVFQHRKITPYPSVYANNVDYVIGHSQVDDYFINGTIVGIELGNEEESYWYNGTGINPKPANYYFGDPDDGKDFAEHYLAARQKIVDRYPTLPIYSGGSFNKHDSVIWDPTSRDGTGGSAGAFLAGFIDEVTRDALAHSQSKFAYLPQYLATHGYSGQYNPEGVIDSNQYRPISEWHEQLDQFAKICHDRGWYPLFANTEYAFSPEPGPQVIDGVTYGNPYSPLSGASNRSQATYFLRSSLIHATMSPTNSFNKNLYFHHPREAGSIFNSVEHVIEDYGFHGHENDNYPGAIRPIHELAWKLFSATQELQVGMETTKVLHRLETKPYGLGDERVAWCAWETTNGNKWLAVWRYLPSTTTFYTSSSGDDVDVAIQGDYSSYDSNQLWQFTITDSTAQFSQPLGSAPTGSYNSTSKLTTFSNIPNVTESPMFLKLDH